MQLENICPKCNGSGWEPHETFEKFSCDKCNGAGVLLTKDGMEILCLMRKYFHGLLPNQATHSFTDPWPDVEEPK